MADITKMANTAGALSGATYYPSLNGQSKASGMQAQYFADETRAYAQQMGDYASNVFLADCQGLNPDDFYAWKKVKIRSIRAAQAQTGETMPEDWQRIYIYDPQNMTYLPQGAMMKYNDNTWIVYKGKNISAIHGSAVVRRCNAVIHVLDWYGNIVDVPMSYAKMGTLGNATHATENTITSKNYMSCICQLNEYSWEFEENTRIILGKTAYAMRGLDNFTREYTDDPDSIHLLTFTIERTELQPYDSVEHQVADYDGFSWRLSVDWNNSMTVGQTQTLRVTSIRNGQAVSATDDKPISYLFSSDAPDIATVDENGVVTGVAQGTVNITVALAQNPSITETVAIDVPAAESHYTAFITTIPAVLREYDSITVSAAYFEDGVATADSVDITFFGPEAAAYKAVAADEPNTYRLTCYHATPKPLIVTASANGYSAQTEIKLIF